MKCAFPITLQINEHLSKIVGCGRCMQCRINKKREWKGRLLLEHAHSRVHGSFVTLTYNDAHLPENASLDVSDAQKYLKRLRERYRSGGMRYFLVGEYGTKSWRPHYHALLFNLEPDKYEQMIRDSWGDRGFVQVDEVNRERCDYVCDYTTKRMTSPEDHRLEGRKPEFFISSRRPPIGRQGFNQLLDAFYTDKGSKVLATHHDIPPTYRFGGKVYPLPARWRAEMREHFGIDPGNIDDTMAKTHIEATKPLEQKLAEKLRREHEQAKEVERHDKLYKRSRKGAANRYI
jgi:hypothetical protein